MGIGMKDGWNRILIPITLLLLLSSCQKINNAFAEQKEREQRAKEERAKEARELWAEMEARADSVEKTTLVLIAGNKKSYHYSTTCISITDNFRMTTEYEAKESGRTLCIECEEKEEAYNKIYNDPDYYDDGGDQYDPAW